jgi:tetratricopeptide (TPR) repeat protein
MDGIEHYAAGRTDEAISAYRQALEINAEMAMAWNGLAMALAKAGDLDAALAAAKRVVELEPEEALAHTSLSVVYQRLGMIPEAEEESAISMRLQEEA